jgi:hypothetical protein
MRPLEADAIIACLERHGVRYVLIGGLAAVLHGFPQVTFDADICPARRRRASRDSHPRCVSCVRVSEHPTLRKRCRSHATQPSFRASRS